MRRKPLLVVLALILTISLTGCGLFFQSPGTGSLAIYLADLPGDLEEVNVFIDRVEVKRNGEQWETINDFNDFNGTPEVFDLLELQYFEALLGEKELSAGEYNQIRLIVAAPEENDTEPGDIAEASHIVKDGELIPLHIPSGMQTGLKMHYNFTVVENYITELILDVDVERLIEAGKSGKYILHPTEFIYVFDKAILGEIIGRVLEDDGNDGEVIDRDITITLYRVENGEKEEIRTLTAIRNGEALDGSFKFRGLSEGEYELEIEADDFVTKNVTEITVKAGKTNDLGDILLEKDETD